MNIANSSNVVRLPAAAVRQVKQRSIRAAREYKRTHPWPGTYEFGPMRAQRLEAERKAAILMGIDQTPAMLIVHAMLAILTDEQRQTIASGLAGGVVANRKAHIEALALVQTSNMTIGAQVELFRAIDKLSEAAHHGE
jgi:hypothetical protein